MLKFTYNDLELECIKARQNENYASDLDKVRYPVKEYVMPFLVSMAVLSFGAYFILPNLTFPQLLLVDIPLALLSTLASFIYGKILLKANAKLYRTLTPEGTERLDELIKKIEILEDPRTKIEGYRYEGQCLVVEASVPRDDIPNAYDRKEFKFHADDKAYSSEDTDEWELRIGIDPNIDKPSKYHRYRLNRFSNTGYCYYRTFLTMPMPKTDEVDEELEGLKVMPRALSRT